MLLTLKKLKLKKPHDCNRTVIIVVCLWKKNIHIIHLDSFNQVTKCDTTKHFMLEDWKHNLINTEAFNHWSYALNLSTNVREFFNKPCQSYVLYYKALQISNLRETDIYRNKRVSFGLNKYTSLLRSPYITKP
jgi:hypothetical protein